MASVSGHPTGYDSGYSAYSVSDLANGETDSSSTNYATISLTRGNYAETIFFYTFSLNIPADAVIESVSCSCKCYINVTASSLVSARQVQLYAGSTAKGTASTVANNTTVFNMDCGTWTASELNNAKIRIYAARVTRNTSTNYYFRFYGATLSVTYTVPVTGDKIFCKVNGSWVQAQKIYVKVGGSWSEVNKVYKKVNGSWVEQDDKSSMFEGGGYVKG